MRPGALLVLALAAGFAGSCHAPQRPPPVILIVVDTLRADHLEWYGYERATSPGLRSLLREGTVFENAFTPEAQTTPAIASMLTGLYPARHGARFLYMLLHDRNRTAAELLAAAGYDTAAFVSSFVMVRDFSNLSQGFGVYDDFVSERERFRDSYERKAEATLELAGRWLGRRRDERPFFLFVHLIDPHGPYAPPRDFAARFRSPEVVPVTGVIPDFQQIPGVRDLGRYRDLYDGEIAYADDALSRFLELLRQRDLFEGSLVVFTADHGESMGERGVYFWHGSDVFQENIHVPLIVKPPAGFAKGPRRVDDAVSHVDLLPTLLAVAGLEVPPGLDGRSLAPLLRGDPMPPTDLFAFAETKQGNSFALIDGMRKTMLRVDPRGAERLELYDLKADPRERAPAGADGPAVARLRARQEAWSTLRLPFEVEHNFMPLEARGAFIRRRLGQRGREDARRLRSLGYVN